MSYTTLHRIGKDGEMTEYEHFHNSWKGAMFVWDALGRRYLNKNAGELMVSGFEPVWDLFLDPRLQNSERIVLGSTFDKVIIRRENLSSAAFSFGEFAGWYDTMGDRCSIASQGAALSRLAKDKSCFGVCWTQNSVAGDVWVVVEGDEYRWYDVTRDDEHWFLYDKQFAYRENLRAK